MSATMSPDPSRGFVALPLDVLEIEMSPGAFRTLVEFCRMADADGFCWPSLEQLGARLSRSRAAISGYVRELRELALVETETQRTANGFNYRLRFRVTFWRIWKSRFRRADDRPPPERRVHPTERKERKNQIHKNHPPALRASGPSEAVELTRLWAAHIGGAPYPTFTTPPPPDLVERTAVCIARNPPMSADMKRPLLDFLASRNIAAHPEATAALTREAARLSPLPDAPALLADALRDAWRPHWKRPPTRQFMAAVVDRIAAENPEALAARVLAGQLCRWQRCEKSLRAAA